MVAVVLNVKHGTGPCSGKSRRGCRVQTERTHRVPPSPKCVCFVRHGSRSSCRFMDVALWFSPCRKSRHMSSWSTRLLLHRFGLFPDFFCWAAVSSGECLASPVDLGVLSGLPDGGSCLHTLRPCRGHRGPPWLLRRTPLLTRGAVSKS